MHVHFEKLDLLDDFKSFGMRLIKNILNSNTLTEIEKVESVVNTTNAVINACNEL